MKNFEEVVSTARTKLNLLDRTWTDDESERDKWINALDQITLWDSFIKARGQSSLTEDMISEKYLNARNKYNDNVAIDKRYSDRMFLHGFIEFVDSGRLVQVENPGFIGPRWHAVPMERLINHYLDQKYSVSFRDDWAAYIIWKIEHA